MKTEAIKKNQTSSTPHLEAIICAVSKARSKSEEYIAEIFGPLDSLSATSIVKMNYYKN
jgi:hypothetical protein